MSHESIRCQDLNKSLQTWIKRGPLAVEVPLYEFSLDHWMRIAELRAHEEAHSLLLDRGEDDALSERGQREVRGWIVGALLRSGYLEHGNLRSEVLPKLQIYDDVMISVDTNILIDCIITGVLLRGEHICSAGIPRPNWVLIIVPKLALAEIEGWANLKIAKVVKQQGDQIRAMLSDDVWQEIRDAHHPWAGRPSHKGRVGQRALQEMLELDTNVEFRGLSVMSAGELPANYGTAGYCKETRADSDIRLQVREFIRALDFHKGTFFLTQDRVNTMMACAEGIQGVYMQKPTWDSIGAVHVDRDELWRVLYELAVSFGEARVVGTEGTLVQVEVFWPAKHVSEWEGSCVRATLHA